MRKWLLPGLSGILLIIRDPVVIAIYLVAMRDGIFPRSTFVTCTMGLAVVSAVTSLATESTPSVILYGVRADFLHLPLIVLLPRILNAEDVRRIGFALLLTLPGMTVLALLQFKGGPDSYWNVGAGGEIGGQLYAAEGKVRASGTFSFVTGMASYLALCTAFLLYNWVPRRVYPFWVAVACLPALILTLVISGSRAAVLSVAIVCGAMFYMAIRRPQNLGAAIRPLLFASVAFVALSWLTPTINEGLAVHHNRFEGGGGLKKGILFRMGEDIVSGWNALFQAPPLGVGLGIGTNAGAKLMSGQRKFLLGEGEWQRVIMETGPVLGGGYLLLRFGALFIIMYSALNAFRRDQSLPLLLASVVIVDLLFGQFGQPTALGFTVFTAGLALAAAEEEPETEGEADLDSSAPAQNRVRGRSAYAERLHGGGENERGSQP